MSFGWLNVRFIDGLEIRDEEDRKIKIKFVFGELVVDLMVVK